ncbi:type VI secretion protein [Streptomyces sp. NPDC051561]|uniref:type VI secretion protein n=1 Tax=Streptomyces sp. NPDC051561 TaxID=3365658 RepID=UPI003796B2EB
MPHPHPTPPTLLAAVAPLPLLVARSAVGAAPLPLLVARLRGGAAPLPRLVARLRGGAAPLPLLVARLGGGAAPRGRNGRARGRPPTESHLSLPAHPGHAHPGHAHPGYAHYGPGPDPGRYSDPSRRHGHTHHQHPNHPRPERGIPDGLLLALLTFVLGLALLTWTATGLSGLFSHGAWPKNVTFPNTPPAIRQLLTAPTDLASAWPATPPSQLSGYGLFWGLFIGQLLILIVLTIFILGTLTRWRLVRAQAREARREAAYRDRTPHAPDTPDTPTEHTAQPAQPPSTAIPQPAEPADPHPTATPRPTQPPDTAPPPPLPSHTHPRTPAFPITPLHPRTTHRSTAVQTLLDAPGPALLLTSDPTLWSETKDARAKLGPVLLYDPTHLCDTPARLHWSPTSGCEDPATAAARARAILTPIRPRAKADTATADTAETLLASWLHAAAIDGRPFKQLLRWAQGHASHEAVRILRTHPKARPGAAGLLESALTSHPERRDMATQLTIRAFSALSSIHIRESCTPNRNDSLTLESFVDEGGTLYVVGEAIEDPRTRASGPGAMPLLTALASDVVEHGRRMAARSSDGRLDPPMTLVLDDVAAVAPLPQLPELLTAGQGQGLPTLALLRSQEQFNSCWPQGS